MFPGVALGAIPTTESVHTKAGKKGKPTKGISLYAKPQITQSMWPVKLHA